MGKAHIFNVIVGLFMAFASFINFSEGFDYVVYPSTGYEKFYLKLNRMMGMKSMKLNFDKNSTCDKIFKSPSVPTKSDVDIIHEDDWFIENELNFNSGQSRPKKNLWHMFTGPSYALLVNVSVLQEVIGEMVFPCVVRVRENSEKKLYLISGLYDFNRGIERENSFERHHGRFVFDVRHGRGEVQVNLVAVAEERVPVRYWYEKIQVNTSEEFPECVAGIDESRAICNLTMESKLRICAVGLYGKGFFSLDDRIEPQCKNIKAVFIKGSTASLKHVWAIGCRTEPIREEDEYFEIHYISHGFEPDQFLIHSRSKVIRSFYLHLDEDNCD